MKNKCKNCNKEFEASTKIAYCSKNCAYGIIRDKIIDEIKLSNEKYSWLGDYNIKK